VRLLLDTHALLWWLGGAHRDPFDRMLVAQALVEGLPIVSNDAVFDDYVVQRIW